MAWHRTKTLVLVLTFSFTLSAFSPEGSGKEDPRYALIPRPVHVVALPGEFTITEDTAIVAPPAARETAMLLRGHLAEDAGLHLPLIDADAVEPSYDGNLIEPGKGDGRSIRFEFWKGADDGAHELAVRPEGVTLRAGEPRGLYWACQTLRQLIRLSRRDGDDVSRRIPAVVIEDRPRFGWRGLMLDCSRTFQSLEYLRATVDRMAYYKMNVLHLHLTDDQGWRLEIEAFPELTEKGARFPGKWDEPEAHQGFYRKKDMKALVAYAAARGITLVPEIEMPGHTLAVLACFPELSCTGGPFEIHPFFKGPGIHPDIFCAGREETFDFLEKVLAEVFEIFPSRCVHIGGDEAPKARWNACPRCRERMTREGIQDVHGLQSWFIRRIERFINAHGRVIIGWDEILEGGLAPNAAVMSWRGTAGGLAAARAGHDVVMSPTSHCYFDYSYDRIDTERAYAFEPVPDVLEPGRVRHVLGLQANFWSHIDREPEKVDRQLFPRLLAIAERGWSAKAVRDREDFMRRVAVHLPELARMGVRYRGAPAEGTGPRETGKERASSGHGEGKPADGDESGLSAEQGNDESSAVDDASKPEVFVQSASDARLPEGRKGLAAHYPGDRGIENDPAVLFTEFFEHEDLDALDARWDEVKNREGLSYSEDVPPGSTGRSLVMTHVGGEGTGSHLYRRLLPGHQTVFARFYVKFDGDCAPIHHFGTHLGGFDPPTPWPQGGAGIRPDGSKRFTSGVEPYGGDWRWDFYTYWQGMHVHGDGNYWGTPFLAHGARPSVIRDQWISVEMMLHMNDPVEAANGEQAFWIDGELFSRGGQVVSHAGEGFPRGRWTGGWWSPDAGAKGAFEGFRWRSVKRLAVNYLWTYLYITKAEKGHVSRVYFDHIVVARKYIGPLEP